MGGCGECMGSRGSGSIGAENHRMLPPNQDSKFIF